jgi:ubiquinone/menaquinone biosynthesis C-methylase UbiE
MVSREINLLTSLPKQIRNVQYRAEEKTPEVIAIAKQFGKEYFDGDRRYGYGGYKYDGRWVSVAQDISKFFALKKFSSVLDIGCGKGFLVYDLMRLGGKLDVYGVDISQYAIDNCYPKIAHRLQVASAEKLPFADKTFDLVLSINALHNLPVDGVITALKEIERVCRGNSYIVVDAYHNEEQKALFENWCLTAETHGTPEFWLSIFDKAEYKGFYGWNVLT